MISGPVYDAALRRAVLIGLLIGLGVFFSLLPTTDDWRALLSGFGSAFVGAVLTRGFGEGHYDNKRAEDGNMSPGDVPMASNHTTVTRS